MDDLIDLKIDEYLKISGKVNFIHRSGFSLLLMNLLDTVWREPLKNTEDVDKIVEKWRELKIKHPLSKLKGDG